MKKFLFLCLTVFVAATMLTGCGKQGRLYGKSKVLDYMQEKVPQEKYSLKSVEKVPDADVSTEIYTFQSKSVILNSWQKIRVVPYSWIQGYMAGQ